MPASGQPTSSPPSAWLSKPEVGSVLTILSGLAFLGVCMILPLVGKAGVETVHYGKNLLAFCAVLGICTALSALAFSSKVLRRSIDHSPKPVITSLLLGTCVLLWISVLTGFLKI